MRGAVILVEPGDVQPIGAGSAHESARRRAGAGGFDHRTARDLGLGAGLHRIGAAQVQRFRLGDTHIDQRAVDGAGIFHGDGHRCLGGAAIAVGHLIGEGVLATEPAIRGIGERAVGVPGQGAVRHIGYDLRHVQRVAVQIAVIVQDARCRDGQRRTDAGGEIIVIGIRIGVAAGGRDGEEIDPRRFAKILDAAQGDLVAIIQIDPDAFDRRLARAGAAGAGPGLHLDPVHQHGELRGAVILVEPGDVQPIGAGGAHESARRRTGAGGFDHRTARDLGLGAGLHRIGAAQIQRFRLGNTHVDQRAFDGVRIFHGDRHRCLGGAAIAVGHLIGKAVLATEPAIRGIGERTVGVPSQGAVGHVGHDLRHVQRVAVQIAVIVQDARRRDGQRRAHVGGKLVVIRRGIGVAALIRHGDEVDPRRFAQVLDPAQGDRIAGLQGDGDAFHLDLARGITPRTGPGADLDPIHQRGKLRHAIIFVDPADIQPIGARRPGKSAGRGARPGGFDHRATGNRRIGAGFNRIVTSQGQCFRLGHPEADLTRRIHFVL